MGMNKKYAYVRVSSRDQCIDRQLKAMREIGLTEKQIYIDRQSGKDFNRKNYQKLIKRLNSGDELYIKSIDRLGRNYDEIIDQWRKLTREKNIDIIVLDFPLLDTRNKVNGLTGKFMADLVLQILSYVAQIERENTHQRQAEGIKAAKEKGVKFGRPALPYPEQFGEIYQMYRQGNLSKRECSRRLNTNHTTFTNWVKRYEETVLPKEH